MTAAVVKSSSIIESKLLYLETPTRV